MSALTLARRYSVPAERTSNWRAAAACIGEDPDLFFAVGTSGPALKQEAAAKAVCARCVVRGSCLSWAMTTGETDGVWGGMTTEERARRRHRTGGHR